MFESKFYPEMNVFLEELGDALKKLIEPREVGFYIAYFSPVTDSMTIEKIGVLSKEISSDYMSDVFQKIYKNLPGTISAGGYRVAVHGINSPGDQAVALLWLIAKHYVISKKGEIILPGCPVFWDELPEVTKKLQETLAPKNPFVCQILNLLK